MEKIHIISDGTTHNTTVLDANGNKIPGLTAVGIKIDAETHEVKAVLEAFCSCDVVAETDAIPRIEERK